MKRVLVIDDEPQIRSALRAGLERAGFTVSLAGTGREGLAAAATEPPDLVLLDLLLPDTHGFAVCQELRARSEVPIIVLSVREDERDKIAALNVGADDYLTKPFSLPELIARMGAVLRRALPGGTAEPPYFRGGDLFVDFAGRRVILGGEDVRLTPTEYDLLRQLVLNAGRVLTYRVLTVAVWGPAAAEETRTLRVHIANLRNKIEADPTHPRYIHTETKIGYRFRVRE